MFDGVRLEGFKSRANAFLLASSALSLVSPSILSSSSFHRWVVWGWGLWTDRVFSLSPVLAQRTPNNNNNNNINILFIIERKCDIKVTRSRDRFKWMEIFSFSVNSFNSFSLHQGDKEQ